MAKLHENNIVHADVKPRNVVFVDETWKLIDLDAARAVDVDDIIDTSAAGFKWTSGFASPELARCVTSGTQRRPSLLPPSLRVENLPWALAADPKMDVFSLGILIFELVTGHPLFLQDTCNNSMIDPRCVVRLLLLHALKTLL